MRYTPVQLQWFTWSQVPEKAVSGDSPGSPELCSEEEWSARSAALQNWPCICLYVQANRSKPKCTDDLVPQTSNTPVCFALEGKGENKPNNNKILMGIKSKKTKCLKNYFWGGNMYWLTRETLYHMYCKFQDLSGNKKALEISRETQSHLFIFVFLNKKRTPPSWMLWNG